MRQQNFVIRIFGDWSDCDQYHNVKKCDANDGKVVQFANFSAA